MITFNVFQLTEIRIFHYQYNDFSQSVVYYPFACACSTENPAIDRHSFVKFVLRFFFNNCANVVWLRHFNLRDK